MIVDIVKLFWDAEQKKIKRGRALALPISCLVAFLGYTVSVEVYAKAKTYIEDSQKAQKELAAKVEQVEQQVSERVPLTVGEVQQQLKNFEQAQIKLYSEQLNSQSRLFQAESSNLKQGVKDVVDIVITKQEDLTDSQLEINKDIGKVTAVVEMQAKQIETLVDQSSTNKQFIRELRATQTQYLQDQLVDKIETDKFRQQTQQVLDSNRKQNEQILQLLQQMQQKIGDN